MNRSYQPKAICYLSKNGQIISDKEGIQERWREYIQDQLNKEEKLGENEMGQEGEIYTNEEMNK
jgi:hypothetical protein